MPLIQSDCNEIMSKDEESNLVYLKNMLNNTNGYDQTKKKGTKPTLNFGERRTCKCINY